MASAGGAAEEPAFEVPIAVGADLEVTPLAPGVWLHTTWRVLEGAGRFPSHGLVVRSGEGGILIDTAWGAEPTRRLLDWVEEELGFRVLSAVVTHFHADRLGGAAVLEARGIPFFGHPRTRELVPDRSFAPVPLAGLDTGIAVTVGDVEIFAPGPGHTLDNLAAWVPAERVLFGGCAVRPLAASGLGNTADAAPPAEWAAAIGRLQNRYPTARWVVPSHGDAGGTDLLEHTLGLLEGATRP